MMFVFIFAFVTLINKVAVFAANDASPCGTWEQYKDEHCYILFDGLQSYSESEKICQSNNSSMVAIHYAEEQDYLSNYIFTKKKAVDNVWIGAKYIGNKLYQWADHTPLTGSGHYSNWASGNPKNLTDHCVEMLADETSIGRWSDERCEKRNMVVCQRMPPISMQLLAGTVIELKHSLQQLASRLVDTERTLTQTVSILAETEKKCIQTATTLVEAKKELSTLKKEKGFATIPIGFIYVQLPKDKAPSELWPNMTWKDISTEYEGVFFRVMGGEAASFGQVQQENAPRLEMVYSDNSDSVRHTGLLGAPNNMTLPKTGWSQGIFTGATTGTQYHMYFKHTEITEVRPKNMAIKVYRRTA